VLRRRPHDGEYLLEIIVRHEVAEHVAHAVDEHPARGSPRKRLLDPIRPQRRIEAALERVSGHITETLGEALRVAVLAPWRDLHAPRDGIPGLVRPLDRAASHADILYAGSIASKLGIAPRSRQSRMMAEGPGRCPAARRYSPSERQPANAGAHHSARIPSWRAFLTVMTYLPHSKRNYRLSLTWRIWRQWKGSRGRCRSSPSKRRSAASARLVGCLAYMGRQRPTDANSQTGMSGSSRRRSSNTKLLARS